MMLNETGRPACETQSLTWTCFTPRMRILCLKHLRGCSIIR
jgi:hypothetical protein